MTELSTPNVKTTSGRTKIHLVLPDPHAHPDHNNDRADYIGKLILDLTSPGVDLSLINLGDMWDMASMAGYDKGKKSFWGKTYKKDIEAGLDFDERLFAPIRKAKRKRPFSVFCEGNHEFRLKKAIDMQPELEGTIDFKSFELDKNYDEIVEYQGNTPGIIDVDGVHYAHYFVSGVMGRPVGGEHPAYSLLTKEFVSCTCGHIHISDYAIRTTVSGKRIMGLVAGVYQDYESGWAGEVNKLWYRGAVICRNVEEGNYSPQWVSIEELKREYGN